MKIRPYEAETDFEAVVRIWREVGWIEAANDDHRDGVRHFTADQTGLVAVADGSPECYVSTSTGSIRYADVDLPLSAVTAVMTSHVARRRGLAQRLTSAAVAREAEAGALVSALGVFDQGFYNKLGYGTLGYEHWYALDPAHLRVSAKARPPRRLSKDDWEEMHRARLQRLRGHGACNIDATSATRSEALWATNGFGLGYNDGPSGELTHYVFFSAKDLENGPLNAWWVVYRTRDQFLELMALLAGLGDQIHLVKLREPPGVQLQDLIDQPFRRARISEKSTYESRNSAAAYMQMRICDVPRCVAATRSNSGSVRFNLQLSDPIEQSLGSERGWRGVAGDYVVEFGPESTAVLGRDEALPTLRASVAAFTRLWLGVGRAAGLAMTDDLSGPEELLHTLGEVLRLPPPRPDWDF
ncbi:MAG: GNAT family N-acetyltransferase [Acidimicrobiia bacterium]|nr:GNAT family N-acetyltransferase [Acidimicrobiia bacterium]